MRYKSIPVLRETIACFEAPAAKYINCLESLWFLRK